MHPVSHRGQTDVSRGPTSRTQMPYDVLSPAASLQKYGAFEHRDCIKPLWLAEPQSHPLNNADSIH